MCLSLPKQIHDPAGQRVLVAVADSENIQSLFKQRCCFRALPLEIKKLSVRSP